MAKPVHSMIRVLDEARSVDFYKRAFALEIADRLKFDDFALVYMRNPSSPFEVELTINFDRKTPYTHGDGYGHVASDGAAELVIAPARRGHGLGRALVDAALAVSGGTLEVWSHGDHPAAAALARALGFERTRVLRRMRRSLAEPLPAAEVPDGVVVRAFVPGRDDEPWLRLNARAFASHPEQGRLTLDDLHLRMAEPWFDPAGFLLAERAGQLIGFHWTKIHEDGLGEVYVLGIDPDAQGMRLARPLVVAGLSWLGSVGVDTVMLYVDESNPRAVALYEKLGFTPWTSDVTYRRTASAAAGAA